MTGRGAHCRHPSPSSVTQGGRLSGRAGRLRTGTSELGRYGVSGRSDSVATEGEQGVERHTADARTDVDLTCPSRDDRKGRVRGDATTRASAPARTCEGTIGRPRVDGTAPVATGGSRRGRDGCVPRPDARGPPSCGRPPCRARTSCTPPGPLLPPLSGIHRTLRAPPVAPGHRAVRRARRSGCRSRPSCARGPNGWKLDVCPSTGGRRHGKTPRGGTWPSDGAWAWG
jgi:hypothetical protein